MIEINFTQVEADASIAMPKIQAKENVWNFPGQWFRTNQILAIITAMLGTTGFCVLKKARGINFYFLNCSRSSSRSGNSISSNPSLVGLNEVSIFTSIISPSLTEISCLAGNNPHGYIV